MGLISTNALIDVEIDFSDAKTDTFINAPVPKITINGEHLHVIEVSIMWKTSTESDSGRYVLVVDGYLKSSGIQIRRFLVDFYNNFFRDLTSFKEDMA